MQTPYESLVSTKPQKRNNTPLIVFRSQAHNINIAIASTNTPTEVFRLFRNIKLSFSSHKDRETAAADFTPTKVKTWNDFMKTNPKSYTTKAYNHSHFWNKGHSAKGQQIKEFHLVNSEEIMEPTQLNHLHKVVHRPFPLIYP